MGRTSKKAAKKKAKKPDADVKIPPKREHDVVGEGIKETEGEAKVRFKAEMEAKEKRRIARDIKRLKKEGKVRTLAGYFVVKEDY